MGGWGQCNGGVENEGGYFGATCIMVVLKHDLTIKEKKSFHFQAIKAIR